MHMIFRATHTQYMASRAIDKSTYVFMHLFKVFGHYRWTCRFHMEYDMKIYFAKRLRHNAFVISFIHFMLPLSICLDAIQLGIIIYHNIAFYIPPFAKSRLTHEPNV